MEDISKALAEPAVIDLAASGLTASTITSLGIRPVGPLEIESCGLNEREAKESYVIPYYSFEKKPTGFFRVKILNSKNGAKYTQPPNSPNHIYFPPELSKALNQNGTSYIIVTEGEKKAAAAVQNGFPAVALSGIDSWRSRNMDITVDKIQKVPGSSNSNRLRIRLSATSGIQEGDPSIAKGLEELLEWVVRKGAKVLIVYDTDGPDGLKKEVQRSAAEFAYYLRAIIKIPQRNIKQLTLPFITSLGKVGLDDYLVSEGADALQKQISALLKSETMESFPRRTDIHRWIDGQLSNPKLSRDKMKKIAFSILTELDARGKRLKSADDQYYYFDGDTKTVHSAALIGSSERFLFDARFGQYLYNEFGLQSRDTQVRSGLLDAFISEDPIEKVVPYKCFRIQNDTIDVQMDDHSFCRITSAGSRYLSNGTGGTLFLADQVEASRISQEELDNTKLTKEPPWKKVLESLNLEALPGLTYEETIELTTVLFYISPWLNRWRGTQLPLEVALAEAGSGKSSLYALRLSVLTGRPELQNVPSDLRDWYAAITETPGLWVGDNVRIVNRDARQKISDELCRLITEPDPHVTLRRLYTTSDRARIPVHVTFAVTSIYPPFQSADLRQRSFMLNFKAIAEGKRRGGWIDAQLKNSNGRKDWLLQHIKALELFFKRVEEEWDPNYLSFHRLENYEQCLIIMARVLGLSLVTREAMAKMLQNLNSFDDTTLEGLAEFAMNWKRGHGTKSFTAGDVVDWAIDAEGYTQDIVLTNSRRLGRYIKAHEYEIAQSAKIVIQERKGNKALYHVEDKAPNQL